MGRDSTKAAAYLHLALAMTTVGSIVPAAKVMAGVLPPFLAGALRLVIATAVLFPWALVRHRNILAIRPDRHDMAVLGLQAAGGTVGFTVLMLLGTARTSAADASVVAGTLPAVAALLSVVVLGERPDPLRWLAIALAVGGLAIIDVPALLGGLDANRILGNLLVLGAITCESLFILLNKRLHRHLPPLVQSAGMAGLGLLYLLPPALFELGGFHARAVPASAWVAVVYYGLGPTVLGFVWWYKGAEKVSGTEAGIFTAFVPLAGAALSAFVLDESIDGRHGIALTLVVAAVLLAARAPPASVVDQQPLPPPVRQIASENTAARLVVR